MLCKFCYSSSRASVTGVTVELYCRFHTVWTATYTLASVHLVAHRKTDKMQSSRFSWSQKLSARYFMKGTDFMLEDKLLRGSIEWYRSEEPEKFMTPASLGLTQGTVSWWVVSSGLWCSWAMLSLHASLPGSIASCVLTQLSIRSFDEADYRANKVLRLHDRRPWCLEAQEGRLEL